MQCDATLVESDDRHLATPFDGPFQRFALQLPQQPLRPVELVHEQGAQLVRLGERPGEVLLTGPAGPQAPDLEFLDCPGELGGAHRDHVVDELEPRPREPSRLRGTHAPLGLERHTRQEQPRLDQCAEAPCRLRGPRERLATLELGYVRLEHLREHERHGAL